MLVATVICCKGEFVLKPVVETSGVAFNAESMSKAIICMLNELQVSLTKIRFFVMDGLRANFLAKEALDDVSLMIAATQVLHESEAEEPTWELNPSCTRTRAHSFSNCDRDLMQGTPPENQHRPCP